MSERSGSPGRTYPVKISRTLDLFWSQARAWHGDEPAMSVRAGPAPLPKDVSVEIWLYVNQDKAVKIDKLENNTVDAEGKFDGAFKIAWFRKDSKVKLEELEFMASVPMGEQQIDDSEAVPMSQLAQSEPLQVDQGDPLFSA